MSKQDIARDRARYDAAMHAVQTGVMVQIGRDGAEGSGANAKHLRTGINAAMVEHSALCRLLMERGIIIEEEYINALACAAEAEQARFEEMLRVSLA